MFKKNNKSILDPSLPSSQKRMSGPTLTPPTTSKGPSITKQLLAKFENKYASKVKTAESTDSDISDSEPSAEKETVVEVEEEFNKLTNENANEEAIYESDFETSDSDVPENEKSTDINEEQFKDKNSFLPKVIDEISEESIHENILTFEELMKLNNDIRGSPAIQVINSDPDEISEHLEEDIEEISTSTSDSIQPLAPNLSQIINQKAKSIGQEVPLNDNIITFSELLKENFIKDPEPTNKVKPTKDNKEDSTNGVEGSIKEVSSAKQISSDKVIEQVPKDKISSPSKTNISTANPSENLPRVTERSSKPKSKRKSNRQSLEERRRLERMFFLLEKQSLQGSVEQPVFKPLAMSWEREAETTERLFDSQLASPEDAFAEMLRLRLRLTRDKMAAEYAAYRSCCVATQILASSHQPVTLAATRQIISQLKQPDHPEKDS